MVRVEVVLQAHQRIKNIATKDDLPFLAEALRSERNDFWTRELLAEPIAYLGGSNYIPDLLIALDRNYKDGHDNDSLEHFLTEIALRDPEACKTKLDCLLNSTDFQYRDQAKWLLEYCNQSEK